jgi:hypothetical protein
MESKAASGVVLAISCWALAACGGGDGDGRAGAEALPCEAVMETLRAELGRPEATVTVDAEGDTLIAYIWQSKDRAGIFSWGESFSGCDMLSGSIAQIQERIDELEREEQRSEPGTAPILNGAGPAPANTPMAMPAFAPIPAPLLMPAPEQPTSTPAPAPAAAPIPAPSPEPLLTPAPEQPPPPPPPAPAAVALVTASP